jgi:FkbM family methyltransferase
MKKKSAHLIRIILYKLFSFENYLYVLSRFYFLSFNLGLLKNNKNYAYPYFLKNIIQKNDVVIDLGANLGYYSKLFSRLTGKNGKVYAVEPIKPILNVLRKNTKNRENITILPYALGTENKEISLGNDTKSKTGYVASGSNFVLDSNTTKKYNAEVKFKAKMRKGSEVFKFLEKLDFIKIDVEGYETVIIPELEDIILKFKPFILMETKNEKRREMLKFLSNRGYYAFILLNKRLIPTNEKQSDDILFVPKERLEKISEYITNK